ncbi:Cytochrome P450 2U1 [Holothuria leucospilota]|uniref:Cytochrome P450 2U1 n=1 Tax=Holothuria leucospilota TaxID=206669 RepID=A0A9Q1CLB7_HOLLE|nr:Cytochrome P450 2U1 [Holothuria leucospilota]
MGQSSSSQNGKGIPPGPWNPFVVLGIPRSPAEILTDMSRYYGPVFSFRMIGAPLTVVLNNYEVIREALIDNSDAFPTRVTSPLRHSWGIKGRLFYSLGEDQKIIRKFVLDGLKHFQEGILFQKVSEEARHLCNAFDKQNGEGIETTHLLTLASGNIMSILNFGKRYDYNDETIIKLMEHLDYLFLALKPGNPVQQFPWLYDTFLYRKLKESQEYVKHFIQEEIKSHRATLDPANPRDFIDMYLMRIEGNDPDDLFNDERAWFTIKDVFSASSNPSAAALQWMIALVCRHQEMQEKIYEEIQTVIGNERLPAFSDLQKMPFTHAFMMEVIRYRSVAPFGTREVFRDVVIDGYNIPKGSRVFLNYWAAERDPEKWDNPEEFIPERFLNADGTDVIKKKFNIPLGIGHRDCMGQTLANMEMFLFGTNLIQKFHLKFSPDEPEPPLVGICGTLVVCEKFKLCAIRR